MKFTLEHALILILAVALIYYVVKHKNLLTDLVRIPERDHPELKAVKDKHKIKSKFWTHGFGLFLDTVSPF